MKHVVAFAVLAAAAGVGALLALALPLVNPATGAFIP
jgi:hypothetical protein